MKYKTIKKIHDGHFIHRYDITYELEDGTDKTYEMISRSPDARTLKDLQPEQADAVVLMIHDEKKEKLLLSREFRLAVGKWVMNFPAGLIEPGETPKESARRELKEETGLDLTVIEQIMPLSYSAIGFSNETNIAVCGTATGEFHKSTSAAEEIQAAWYTKEEVAKLLQTEPFASRTQTYCYMWCRS